MFISYPGKAAEQEILDSVEACELTCVDNKDAASRLIRAENLSALKALLATHAKSVDLIYIDPPFATNADFTISEGRNSTISRKSGGSLAYSDKLTGPDYLEFLRHRLVLLRELLSDKRIYLSTHRLQSWPLRQIDHGRNFRSQQLPQRHHQN